ncbi:MAG: SDR family oxidoreductase [Acidimicrobiia bacterium]|nr:SDR family oxidoreductase [Acidimicrobiia bacterium]MDH3396996.1 SDR family oxidoreductase [Acidimicrobiia bacterium]
MAKTTQLAGKTAIVCGGSKGIGLSTAAEIVRRGGSVGVVARGNGSLELAGERLRALVHESSQFVDMIQADAANRDDVGPKLEAFMEARGVPDYLINAVGYAGPDYVSNLVLDDFRQQMDVNYYGQLIPTLVVLPHLLEAGRGHIAFVSSMLGYFGIIGYAAYAPSKFALVGLAEVLRHELRPSGLSVSVLYPPDTDTPGFEVENISKPVETHQLSANVKVAQPDEVARQFLDGIMRGKFHILPSGAGMVWRLQRYAPRLVRAILDQALSKARRRVGKT